MLSLQHRRSLALADSRTTTTRATKQLHCFVRGEGWRAMTARGWKGASKPGIRTPMQKHTTSLERARPGSIQAHSKLGFLVLVGNGRRARPARAAARDRERQWTRNPKEEGGGRPGNGASTYAVAPQLAVRTMRVDSCQQAWSAPSNSQLGECRCWTDEHTYDRLIQVSSCVKEISIFGVNITS